MDNNDADDDVPVAMSLTPFFEPEYPDAPHNEVYHAGFKDEDGTRWGVVPLPRNVVEHAVFLENIFQPVINVDGTVRAWPVMAADELFGEMDEKGNLPVIPIDTLVAEKLDANMDEPDYGEDGVLQAYYAMRERLKAALDLVESEILRRTTMHPPSTQIN